VLWRRGWLAIDREARRRVPRIVLASVLMAAAIFGGHHFIASALHGADSALARIATLMVLVGVGLGVYLAAVQALGIARLKQLREAMRARI
jgi:putative peptidoglycan lipid II flippase